MADQAAALQAALDRIAQLEQALNNLQQQPPLLPQPPPGAQQATVFALSPARLTNQGIIDYSTAQGAKLYKAAVAPLDSEHKFDLSAERLNVFLEQFKTRAKEANWNSLLLIGHGEENEGRYLPDEHGSVPIEEIRTKTDTYYNQPTREAQISTQIYTCLHASLTEEAISTVLQDRELYALRVNGNPEPFEDGLLYLHVICKHSGLTTNATKTHLQTLLTQLDQKMVEVSSDVSKFNDYFASLLRRCHAFGYRPDESTLVTHLLQGYKTCADAGFKSYIRHKEDAHNDGTSAFTVNKLLADTGNYYRIRTENGEWMEATEEQKKIVALTAQLQELEKLKSKGNDNKPSGNKGKGSKRKGKGGGGGKNKDDKQEKTSWKSKPPEKGKKWSMEKDGKTWLWCLTHRRWGFHADKDCRARKKDQDDKSDDNKPKPSSTSATDEGSEPKLRLNANLAAILENDKE